MMRYGGWFPGDHVWLWALACVALIVLVVVLVVLVARQLGRPGAPTGSSWPATQAGPSPLPPARPEPLDILRERFARGEITLDEFETAQRALGYPSNLGSPPSGPAAPPHG